VYPAAKRRLWHWQSGPLRQILNQSIEFRIILRAYLLTAVHLDDDFVAEPITEEIHASCQKQGYDGALTAAEHVADPDQQSGQHSQ
jgi:predicted ester cyclase